MRQIRQTRKDKREGNRISFWMKIEHDILMQMKKSSKKLKGKKMALLIMFSLFVTFLIYIFFGFKYSFSTGSWFNDFPGARWKRTVLERVCTLGGGISEYNLVELGSKTTYSCINPFPDYGESCTGSYDCEGECEMVGAIPQSCYKVDKWEYRCPQVIKGTCSYKSYNIFDGWNEVLENKIIVHKEAII